MASIGHVAVGMACGRAYSDDPQVARKAMVALSLLSLWPDVDAVAFLFGIPYAHSLGHRGATHSILLAAFVALAAHVWAQRKGVRGARLRRHTIITAIVALSHPILDTMTFGGGLGCALLWPISDERFWAPVRFIPIAPIGLRLLSSRGLLVMATEIVVFAPFWLFAIWPRRRAKV